MPPRASAPATAGLSTRRSTRNTTPATAVSRLPSATNTPGRTTPAALPDHFPQADASPPDAGEGLTDIAHGADQIMQSPDSPALGVPTSAVDVAAPVTIDLVSRATTVDIVSPTIDADAMLAVRSPPSSIIDIPISMMVVAAAADLAATRPAPDEDFPPLPAPGDEVMDPVAAAARRAEKEKRRVSLSAEIPQPLTDHNTPHILSPIDVDAPTFGALDAHTIATSTLLDDDSLGGFFDTAAADTTTLERAIEASLATTPEEACPDPHFDAEMRLAMERSLGRNTDSSSQDASTSRRPTGASGSPPKRPRIDTSRTTRMTRASSAAATQAADAAGAALVAAAGSISAPATTARPPVVLPTTHTPFPPPQGSAVPPLPANTTVAQQAIPAAVQAGAAVTGAVPQAAAAAAPQVAAAAVVAAAAALLAPPPGAAAQNWATFDGNPPRAFITATDNAPHTVGVDRAFLTNNADANQMRVWDQTPDILLVYVGGGSSDPVADSHLTSALITDVINMPPDVIRVGAASAADARLPTPPAFAVAGVPPALGAELLCLRVLCSTAVTLFVTELHPALSGFLGIVEGFTFPNSPQGAVEAANAILTTHGTSNNFIQLLVSHRDALPANLSIQRVLETVLGSISVTPLELLSPRGCRVVWQVYMMVTMTNAERHCAIRTAFSQVTFGTDFNNAGHVRADMRCRGCFSIDHPTPICPFPLIPGWMGYTATTLTANTINNANRGGRGRGNGRGRGGRGRGGRGS
ncbi:hypothetical protein C8J57DRAFT_1254145 [Mycena rebaudengoi]|nr:hypothetical protein C8J57DRAFT_1254145 [Mycena rebaudengoi]